MPTNAQATVIRQASLAELTKASDVILHGVVRFVDDDLSTSPRGPFRTAIEIEIIEGIKGLKADQPTFRLVLPGGKAHGRVMRIPGMPTFAPGDEVVLLLEPAGGTGYALAGLSQGVFKIDRSFKQPRAVRRNYGAGVAVGGKVTHVDAFSGPTTLDNLLGELRHLVGGAR